MPVKEKCPQCGGMMVRKFDRKGSVYHLCVDPACKYKSEPMEAPDVE
jgi:ssDNA-binding Zn-finger/Zn-ribbon topoisomerase 1